MSYDEVKAFDTAYWKLIDAQVAPYEAYARKHGLTEKEMYVLEVIWSAPDGCTQSEICEWLSATKQTVSAIVKKFLKQGYLFLEESKTDRRSKIIRLTGEGFRFAEALVPPVLNAQVAAMAELSRADIEELLRITALLSHHIQEKFAPLLEDENAALYGEA